jgi:hypothetical protein
VDLKCIKWSFILDKDKKAGSKDEICRDEILWRQSLGIKGEILK